MLMLRRISLDISYTYLIMGVFQKVLLVKTTSCYRKRTEGGKQNHYEHSEIERSVAYL